MIVKSSILKICSVVIFLSAPLLASAAEATLSLSSANGVFSSSKNFVTRVVVNSGGGAGINAVESVLNYNPKEIKVVKISTDGSIFNIWPIPPSFDNKLGIIKFAGGSAKAYKDSAGLVMQITFQPLVKGDVLVGISTSTSMISSANGTGLDILKEVDAGDYTFGSASSIQASENLRTKMTGRILLQVEKFGRSWYVYPKDRMRYFLGRPVDAFNLMRKLGLGVTHAYITKYEGQMYPASVAGRILLDVEDSGKAYYIYPVDGKAYYLGRPKDAFAIMRNLGLGISNAAIKKIPDWAI